MLLLLLLLRADDSRRSSRRMIRRLSSTSGRSRRHRRDPRWRRRDCRRRSDRVARLKSRSRGVEEEWVTFVEGRVAAAAAAAARLSSYDLVLPWRALGEEQQFVVAAAAAAEEPNAPIRLNGQNWAYVCPLSAATDVSALAENATETTTWRRAGNDRHGKSSTLVNEGTEVRVDACAMAKDSRVFRPIETQRTKKQVGEDALTRA